MTFTVEHPLRVSSLILCSALANGEDFRDGCLSRLTELPWEIQQAIYTAEVQGNYETKEYEDALEVCCAVLFGLG